MEPEVDLTTFLEKQRQDPEPSAVAAPLTHDEDEIDASLAHMVIGGAEDVHTKKGKVQQMQWDASLEEMSREKAAADAARGAWYHFGLYRHLRIFLPPLVLINHVLQT